MGHTILCLLVMVGTAVAVPLASENSAAMESRDKRSGEVIFFENQQKRGAMEKRSENWPILNNIQKDPAASKMPLTIDSLNEKHKDEGETIQIDRKTLEAIEEEAFYEALEFLVDRLVNQIYDGADEQEETTGSSLSDMTTVAYDMSATSVKATTTASETTNRLKEKYENLLKDREASQLASLLSSKMSPSSPKQLPVQQRSSADATPEHNGEDSLRAKPESSKPVNEEHDMEEITLTTPYPADLKDPLGSDYNFKNIMDYVEYLNMLKTVERKLQSEISQYKGEESHHGNDVKTKSRRKRSIEEPPLGWKDGVNNDDGLRTQEGEAEQGGICFTAEEVNEMKELLLQLAKEKLQSQDLLNYLMGPVDQEVNDDMERPDSLEPGYYDTEGGYNFEPEVNLEYLPEAKDEEPELDRLALKMGRPAKRPSYYYGAANWPYYKK